MTQASCPRVPAQHERIASSHPICPSHCLATGAPESAQRSGHTTITVVPGRGRFMSRRIRSRGMPIELRNPRAVTPPGRTQYTDEEPGAVAGVQAPQCDEQSGEIAPARARRKGRGRQQRGSAVQAPCQHAQRARAPSPGPRQGAAVPRPATAVAWQTAPTAVVESAHHINLCRLIMRQVEESAAAQACDEDCWS